MQRLFWSLLPDVREGERSRFLFFAGLLTLVSVGQTLGLAGAEALFLAKIGVAALPLAFVGAAATTVFGSMLYAARVGHARNDTLFWQMLLLSGALLLGSSIFVAADAHWIYPALFCLWYLTTAVSLNHFWTFSGDYFDNLDSKRLIPLFNVGTSVGGTLGGVLAVALARTLGATSLIVAWGVTLLAAAALLGLGRRALRRWGPLEPEEADETSVESLRGATSYVRASPLAGWLVVSALGMVLAAFLAQYLYSDIFVREFPEPVRLATFLSAYLAITNVVEILIGMAVTPWLIKRLGVPGANLLHPVLMFFSFVGMAFRFGLPSGIAARAAEELMDNALAAPLRSLLQNAIPTRFRGRVRAFLEGIVVYAGMAAAGVLLLLLRDPDPLWLCAAGGGATLFYLFANWRARRAYLATLVDQLRAGRLDLAGVGGDLGNWEAARLAALWEETLRGDGGRPSTALLELVPALAARRIVDPLLRAASHPNAAVRRASIAALGSLKDARLAGPLALALDDSEPSVRLAALRGVAKIPGDLDFLRVRIDDLRQDLDPQIRAEASTLAGPEGRETLTKMLRSPHAAEALAALRAAGSDQLAEVAACVRNSDAGVRATALERAAELSEEPPLEAAELIELLRDPDAAVRGAAVKLAAGMASEEVLAVLGERLADPSGEVRSITQSVLGKLGDEGLAVAKPRLRDDSERPVTAALHALAARNTRGSRAYLHHELRYRARRMWWYTLAHEHLPPGDGLPERFLRAALIDAVLRERRLAFRILRLLETERVIRRVERELRSASSHTRSHALDVLSNLGDREAARLLVLIHETGPIAERRRDVAGPNDTAALLAGARSSDNPWLRLAARAVETRADLDRPEEERMQRILALKQVDLFANLSFEQLDAILESSEDAEYLPGEQIFLEDERGDRLFLLLEGSVDIIKDFGKPTQRPLGSGTVEAVGYFGEMAILADDRRSASVFAATGCHLLTLEASAFRDLILQIPEISFEIFRVLIPRLKKAEEAASKP